MYMARLRNCSVKIHLMHRSRGSTRCFGEAPQQLNWYKGMQLEAYKSNANFSKLYSTILHVLSGIYVRRKISLSR